MCCKSLKKKLGSDNHICFSNSNVAKENGKELRVDGVNNDEICKIQIDDCLIKNKDQVKCDYMFYFCKTQKVVLVELKGTDVIHAISQIMNTYKIVNKSLEIESKKYSGYIVSTSVPKATEQKFRKAQELALKQSGILIKKVHQKATIKQ